MLSLLLSLSQFSGLLVRVCLRSPAPPVSVVCFSTCFLFSLIRFLVCKCLSQSGWMTTSLAPRLLLTVSLPLCVVTTDFPVCVFLSILLLISFS